MSIYLSSGYVDIGKILSYKMPFTFLLGGRATGKSYGSLKTLYQTDTRFMLMRRTQAQCDLINKPEFNPYKVICNDLHVDIRVRSISKYNALIYEDLGDDAEKTIGYTCALSTISSMRGWDASDCKVLLYDEFVPEKHERALKNEGSAFLNAYETMNRNRELQGEDPLQAVCLANAFNIANPIFLELGLVGICEKMKTKGQELYINRDRGILIALLDKSKISQQKKDTALYRVAGGAFADMALKNDFAYNDSSDVKSMSLKEYRLLCTVGEISIYKHKASRKYYISEHRSGTAPEYKSDEVGIKRYQKKHGIMLYAAYMRGDITFEDILTKSLFEIYTV